MHFFGLIHKRPGYDQFFAENPFSPADELVFMGLVARSCHFDVTACAEARRLAQRAERPLRGLSALWASRRASRAGWKTALKVALYDFFDDPIAPLNGQLMVKVNHYNWAKQKKFSRTQCKIQFPP